MKIPTPLEQGYPPDFIEWYITEKNAGWHDTYFAKAAVKDHQAKGNCRFAWHILDYMEEKHWLSRGDLVLDPMCGIGSFLIIAALKGYDTIGIELEMDFVKDMLGYDEYINDPDSLFNTARAHVEGSIEHFRNITRWKKDVGDIFVFQGDARQLNEQWQHINTRPTNVVCSPPYGNRLNDESQKYGSKDAKTFEELEAMRGEVGSHAKQYSLDSENIGNAKLRVLCSPPYSKTTEMNTAQVESLPKDMQTGYRGFLYSQNNIATLADNQYSREMLKVYKSLYSILPIPSYVALITRNFIQEGKIVELDKETIRLMEGAGFGYLEIKRANLPEVGFLKIINWKKFFRDKGLPLITWEEVTFYKKS